MSVPKAATDRSEVIGPICALTDAQALAYWHQQSLQARIEQMLSKALTAGFVGAGMDGYLSGGILTQKERQLLKAADRLSALIKCVEEENAGNREFAGARAQQTAALADQKASRPAARRSRKAAA